MATSDSPWWGMPRGWNTGWDWSRTDMTGPLVSRLVTVLKTKYLGKPVTLGVAGADLVLTPTELDVDLGRMALSTGQLDDVTVTAHDVSWRELRAGSATARFRNTSLRMGSTTQVVAAPVDIEFTVAPEDLDAVLAIHRPRLQVEITADDQVVLRSRAHPDWAGLVVDLDTEGARIRILPRQLTRGSRETQLVRRLPPVSFRVPVPAGRLNIVSVTASSGSLCVQARVDEARIPLGSWLDLPTR